MDKLSFINDFLKREPERIHPGGFWNVPTVKINKETKELLEVLLQESRLTLLQKQHIRASLKSGNHHLPLNWTKQNSGKWTSSNRPSTSPDQLKENRGIRSRQSIISSGCYERTRFRLDDIQHKDCSVEKERLQNLMIYGQDVSPENADYDEVEFHQPTKSVESPKDIIAQLESEIAERMKFLEDMKKLGKGKQYRSIILTEISQRKRQIGVIKTSML